MMRSVALKAQKFSAFLLALAVLMLYACWNVADLANLYY